MPKGAPEPYRAAEDTLLLARGVDYVVECSELVAEIGCGGGLITEVLAERGCEVVATDASLPAANLTWLRVKRRGLSGVVHPVCCDRLEAIREGEIFGLVAFNPPYLPDEGSDVRYSGGPTGTEVPLAFARSALRRLKRRGRALFLLSSLSNWERAIVQLASEGCVVSILKAEHVGLFEELLLVIYARRG